MADGFGAGFLAYAIEAACPPDEQYRIAFYGKDPSARAFYTTEGEWVGAECPRGGVLLKGYRVKQGHLLFDDVALLNADIEAQYAIVYNATTKRVIRNYDFGRKIGVMGGVFDFGFGLGVIAFGAELKGSV